ncbi:MAG TPA: prepilin-type N-terminal cleavage/methylation domain-containing protein [Bryobacteraceae bacterium]|nr:prepilin-type N-terminal cleavage/methylation domain-containing protein [Bryobacteraceae bacterium]
MTDRRGVTLIEVLVAVTLLSMVSVGMLMAMRVGLNAMGRTNEHITASRRVLGVERVLTQQIAGFVPSTGLCAGGPEGASPAPFAFFQGELQTVRFVTTYSLEEASRGYPRIVEFHVVQGENGRGVRLIVNETIYTGPLSTGAYCLGMVPDPQVGTAVVAWRPPAVNERSFVLADKLASCQFGFKEEREFPQPDLWHARWTKDFTPSAIRVDLAPLEPEPGRLQVPSVIAPFRVTRHPFSQYSDW